MVRSVMWLCTHKQSVKVTESEEDVTENRKDGVLTPRTQ